MSELFVIFFKDDILLVSGNFFHLIAWTGWHVGSSLPDEGSSLFLLHWEHRMLTPGPPGKSQCHSSIHSVWCMRNVPK